jgi:hypothetical protein
MRASILTAAIVPVLSADGGNFTRLTFSATIAFDGMPVT